MKKGIQMAFLAVCTLLTPALFTQEKIAILVGVDEYEVLSDLQAGVNDAELMASYYSALGFQTWVLSDRRESRLEQPTLSNFQRILENIQERTKGQIIDELVVFFAGHGVQIQSDNYLCFPETELTSLTGMLNVRESLVPWVEDLGARLTLMFLDACRNELGPIRAGGVERGIEISQAGFTPGQSDVVIFYAAKPGEFSFEKSDGTNGFFTDVLIEALRSDDTSTIADLYNYLRTALPERTEREYGRPQIPHIGGDFDLLSAFSRGDADLGAFDTRSQLFVDASIRGAAVTIDGVIRGETPVLIERVKPGEITVELEKDGLFASTQIYLEPKSFASIDLELKPATGNILIQTALTLDPAYLEAQVPEDPLGFIQDMEVWIGDEYQGRLDSGLITDIKIGSHDIRIFGNGWYWEDRITVKSQNPLRLIPVFGPTGNLVLSVPPDSLLVLKSTSLDMEILPWISQEPQVVLENIPMGDWELALVNDSYEPYLGTFSLQQNSELRHTPILAMNPLGQIIHGIASIDEQLERLHTEVTEISRQRVEYDLPGWIGGGLGVLSAGLASWAFYEAAMDYQSYESALTSEEAQGFRDRSTLLFNLSIGGYIASGLTLGVTLPFFFAGPHAYDQQSEIQRLQIERDRLSFELEAME